MKKVKRLFLAIPVLFITFIFFTYMDNGWSFQDYSKLIHPILFALSLTIMIFVQASKKFFLYSSLILLVGMMFLSLFNLISFANWIGSLGFGELIIVFVCYLPVILKEGYIQNF